MRNRKEEIIRSACRGCHGVCQVLIHRDANGTITRVTGDPESLTSRGYICPKGINAPNFIYHPDRVTRPLLREGARGQGKWRTVTWDEALDLMTARFSAIREESGPEYLAVAQGTGRPYTEFTGRFCHAFGSPNFVSPGHNCFLPRLIGSKITTGWLPQPDIFGRGGKMPQSVLVFGANPMESGAADGQCGDMIRRAMEQAALTIVIDPRATKAARKANLHLALRPGSECALMLAMLHTVIAEDAYDKDFVARHCQGFEALRAHVAPFGPDWAASITRVSASLIREAALAFARAQPGVIIWGNGIDESINAFQTGRATLLFMALCGTLDVPGGMVRWLPPQSIRCKSPMLDPGVLGMSLLTQAQKEKQLDGHRFPFCPGVHPPLFWESCISGTPYRPRAMWLVGTNPILTHTRGDLVAAALRDHLEFTVVSDFFLTPTAALADLVLPAAHWLEQDDVVYFHKLWCVLSRKQLAQVGEVRDDRDVIIELANRLGLTEAFPWKTRREYLDWLLEPANMDFNAFAAKDIILGDMRYRKHETEGFPTPSGKVELVSSVMEHLGLAPLPTYVEPPLSPVSTPEIAADYPFILMTGCKIKPFFHTEGRNIPELRRLHPRPLADMHPDTAARLGLADGQPVIVSTPYGSQRFYLHRDDCMQPDVIHVEHAWWFAEEPGPEHGCFTSNANLLFSHEHFDPNSGAEPLKCGMCNVRPQPGLMSMS